MAHTAVISRQEPMTAIEWPRKPFLCTCGECPFVWAAAWLPFNLSKIQKVTPRCCPACGQTDPKAIVVASKSAGDIQRYTDWLAIELERARAEAAEPSVEQVAITPTEEATSSAPGN